MPDVLQPAPAAQTPELRSLREFQSGANQFFWIAGFTLVNMATVFWNAQFIMLVGLGVTLLANALGAALGPIGMAVSAIFVLAVAGLFGAFGYFSRRGHSWAFIVGITLYVLDALVVLWMQDWVMLAFHGLFAFLAVRGYVALRRLRAAGYSVDSKGVVSRPAAHIAAPAAAAEAPTTGPAASTPAGGTPAIGVGPTASTAPAPLEMSPEQP
jgi:hypothetical protein